MIVIDSRQPEKNRQALRHFFPQEPLIEASLPVGDLLLSPCPKADLEPLASEAWFPGAILIRRQTPRDFLQALGSGDLFLQAQRMASLSSLPVLLVIGEVRLLKGHLHLAAGRTLWSAASWLMALFRLQCAGLVLLQIPEDLELDLYRLLLDRLHQKEAPLIERPVLNPLILAPKEISFLCALPGLGLERAQELWRTEPRLASILVALTASPSLNSTLLPGKALRSRVRTFLGLEEDQILQIGGTKSLE